MNIDDYDRRRQRRRQTNNTIFDIVTKKQQLTSRGVLGKIYPSFSTPQIYYSNNNFDCKNSFHHPFSQQSSSGTIVHHQKYNHRKWPYNQQLQSFSIIMTDEQRLQQQQQTEQEVS